VQAPAVANFAHDPVVAVQQPLFTEMFEPSFRYSGAGFAYQLASAIAGGFTPLIPTALVLYDGMVYGWFTGVGLPKYFNATVEDPKNARRMSA